MDIKATLNQYSTQIILAAFATGILYIIDMLPTTIASLGEKTKWVYLGIMALGAYTFYEFYMSRSNIKIQRTVAPRSLSDPSNINRLRQQRGDYTPPHPTVQPAPTNPPKPSQDVFTAFMKG